MSHNDTNQPAFKAGELVRVSIDGARYAGPGLVGAHSIRVGDDVFDVPAGAVIEAAESDKRTATIAGLRAFADLLESRPDMPLPYGIDGQIGFHGEPGLAEAIRLASTLGIELGPIRDTEHPVQRWARTGKLYFGDVSVTLYAYGLDAPVDSEPAAECCPPVVSMALVEPSEEPDAIVDQALGAGMAENTDGAA